jgi:hypothetical protein
MGIEPNAECGQVAESTVDCEWMASNSVHNRGYFLNRFPMGIYVLLNLVIALALMREDFANLHAGRQVSVGSLIR